MSTVENGWKGYLEDRRPSANGDPYKITNALINTLVSCEEFVEFNNSKEDAEVIAE